MRERHSSFVAKQTEKRNEQPEVLQRDVFHSRDAGIRSHLQQQQERCWGHAVCDVRVTCAGAYTSCWTRMGNVVVRELDVRSLLGRFCLATARAGRHSARLKSCRQWAAQFRPWAAPAHALDATAGAAKCWRTSKTRTSKRLNLPIAFHSSVQFVFWFYSPLNLDIWGSFDGFLFVTSPCLSDASLL